jgi:hypothetical protein
MIAWEAGLPLLQMRDVAAGLRLLRWAEALGGARVRKRAEVGEKDFQLPRLLRPSYARYYQPCPSIYYKQYY